MNTQSHKINGKEINMNLVSKMVREQLKKEFPTCKFSVTSTHNTLDIALMEAPFAAFADNLVYSQNWGTSEADDNGYAQLNPYTFSHEYISFDEDCKSNGRKLTRQTWEVINRAVKIGQQENWDNSDISTDYFDVNYYLHINIGKWNKPFINTAPKTPAQPEPVRINRVFLAIDEE